MIVDSCVDSATGQPAVLDYLESIGVDPEHQVALIVASHHHDDHTKGLAECLSRSPNAQFVSSGALKSREFATLVVATSRRPMMARPGLTEFDRIFEVLRARPIDRRLPRFAVAGLPIWDDASQGDQPCLITCLSPSDEAQVSAYQDIRRYLPELLEPKRRIPLDAINDTSVVLHVMVGGTTLLLASDLQEEAGRIHGWSIILDDWRTHPRARASLMKVAHHGSSNGHHAGVWEQMLEATPTASLCPFDHGGSLLPTTADQQRLCELTPYVFATSGRPSAQSRQGAVERSLRRRRHPIRPIDARMGRVRFRRRPDEDSWRVELFGPAHDVCARLAEGRQRPGARRSR
jgi:hypothetical protein